MSTLANPVEAIRDAYGTEALVSDWFTVTQKDMDKFADCTHDPDWMHIDPERARRDGPFDGTIAFGFWTLSMMSYFNRKTLKAEYPEGAMFGFNYGIDRMRLTAPIPVGSRIRAHIRLADVSEKGEGRYLIKTENWIEVEGSEKPAMTVEWLFMIVFPRAHQ